MHHVQFCFGAHTRTLRNEASVYRIRFPLFLRFPRPIPVKPLWNGARIYKACPGGVVSSVTLVTLPRALSCPTIMLSHTLVALALSAISPVLSTSLTSAPSTLTRSCGTSISGEAIVAAERHFSANKVARKTAAEDRTIDVRPLQSLHDSHSRLIPEQVWFHVISESEELAGGNIADEQVTDQINYLNSAFNSTGLSFALQNITRTVNEDWFNNARPNSTQQTDMKEALRFGLVDTLNVYSVKYVYSSLPASVTGLTFRLA